MCCAQAQEWQRISQKCTNSVQTLRGKVELRGARDGAKIELESDVSHAGWSKPRLQIGFQF